MHKILLAIASIATACGADVERDPLPPTGAPPVYYGQVQRVMNDNCVACHSADPDRLAPFSLATYGDALAAAQDWPLAFAVMNRSMPPYYANQDGDCNTFHNAHWLSGSDIDTLVAWSNGDRLAGDPANSVAAPPAAGGLAQVDRTLDIGAAYVPDATKIDDYRCFVIDALGADKFVTGVHVRPGNASVVHHVIVFTLASQAAEDDVLARDAAAAGAGYPCSGGPTELGASFLTGWVPGAAATLYPDGTGIAVSGARKLVVQIHYNTSNSDGKPDRTTIDLDLADQVAYQATIVSVRGDFDLPPRDPDATATGIRQLPMIAPKGRVWGVALHMHQRGTGAEVTVERPSNSCLIDLDGWSFHWQHMYWHSSPIDVAGGDTLRVTCHYDTSNDPGRVMWGEGTDQEMCLAYLYISL